MGPRFLRTVLACVLGSYWVMGGGVIWQTGSVRLTNHVSAASLPESSELPSSSIGIPPYKLIRRPAIAPIPLPPPTPTSPSVSINTPHSLIRRPSVAPAPSLPPPATTSLSSVNVPGKLIRRPPAGSTSATAPASAATTTSVRAPQIASATVNGGIPTATPPTGASATANTKSKNAAQAPIAIGSVTAPIFAPLFQSTLASTLVNQAASASVGQLSAAAQPGADPASYSRKLTQRSEVQAILRPPPLPPPPPPLGTVTLTWDASISSDVAGYNVYVFTSNDVDKALCIPPINVGNVTGPQDIDLPLGQTYFFAVTAYDTSGNESDLSNEASHSLI